MNCTVQGCAGKVKAKGLCRMHYLRVRRNGDVELRRPTMPTGGKCAVDGCEKPVRAKGFCTLHYRRVKLYGNPLHTEERSTPTRDRLLAKIRVHESSGCWEWTGHRDRKGYGSAWDGETMTRAHRVAYLVFVGEIPGGLFVLHRCDNPPCCNPEHLFLGTHLDNMEDMRNKGRSIKRQRQTRNATEANHGI